MTAAVRPQLVGLTMLDDEDKEGDKLGEEEDVFFRSKLVYLARLFFFTL